MPKFKNSNATFRVIFKQCAKRVGVSFVPQLATAQTFEFSGDL